MTHYTTYDINVTQEFIDAGKPKTCNFCPVALAIKDQTPFDHYVAVLHSQVWLSNDPDRPSDDPASHYADLPAKVWALIEAFDEGKPIKPFQFLLKVRES